jgi:H+/gluconate symporter-like permease
MTTKQLLAKLHLASYPTPLDLRHLPRFARDGIDVWDLSQAGLPLLLGALVYHSRAASPATWRTQVADQLHVELDQKITGKIVGRCAFATAIEFCWRRAQNQEKAHRDEFNRLREILKEKTL